MRTIKNIIAVLACFAFFQPAVGKDWHNVMDYGAKNDSTGKNTEVIKKAIETASSEGGGTVYFPAGKYITGAIHLKSNITLHLEAGAELHFSDDFDDYLPMVESRWEGTEVVNFSPFIYANGVENVTIEGRGLLDGHGKKWWGFSEVTIRNQKDDSEDTKWQKEFKRLNKDVLAPDLPGWVEKGFLRPPFIQFLNSKNIQIKDIKIVNSPFWTINPQYCDNVNIDGVTIQNPPSPNTDGVNPESCRNVRIANCYISVGDDCITIKSGKDRSGRKVNIPAENYTITNCVMLRGHGGVVIGSEMSGGVKNIVISNSVFDGTDRGIRLKTARGRGGVVEDIRVSNIVMRNIRDQAIVLDMQYAKTDPEPISERTPAFRNVFISGLTGSTKRLARLRGLEELPIENIVFADITMEAETGFILENVNDIYIRDVHAKIKTGPAIEAKTVDFAKFTNVNNNTPDASSAVIKLEKSSNINIQDSYPFKETKSFLELKGTENENVFLMNNNFFHVDKLIEGPIDQVKQVNNLVK